MFFARKDRPSHRDYLNRSDQEGCDLDRLFGAASDAFEPLIELASTL
jgi:hypothetical protein